MLVRVMALRHAALKRLVVKTAAQLFRERGFERVGVANLISSTP